MAQPSQKRSRPDRAPTFRKEFGGDNDLKEHMDNSIASAKKIVKMQQDIVMKSADMVIAALDYWIAKHEHRNSSYVNNYVATTRDEVDQQMFLCTTSAMNNIIDQCTQHNAFCPIALDINGCTMMGHVANLDLQCTGGHHYRWMSSPYMPDGKFLANVRMLHGVLSSGIRHVQYDSVVNAAGMGAIDHKVFDAAMPTYGPVVQDLTVESMDNALLEEIAENYDPEVVPIEQEVEPGITIVTDARHGHRRNANDCDVVAIGALTHKVIKTIHVTKDDDPCSQRHEMYGTQKLYEHFDTCLGGDGVHIRCHGHDANASVNKYIRVHRKGTMGQNDTWHGGKNVLKLIKTVAGGSQRSKGTTWHEELSDKVVCTKINVQHAIRNCNKDPEILKELIDNIPKHYQNIHDNCSARGRCRREADYQPSKLVIRSELALQLYTKALHKTVIYTRPQDYSHAIDTYYVESYNNVLNVYHDKRIVFRKPQFEMRTNLTTLDWNENANREHTSIWQPPLGVGKRKKKLVKKSTNFKSDIWNRFMDILYR